MLEGVRFAPPNCAESAMEKQAAYLLGQVRLDEKSKKWVHLVDTAAKDAARLNREIREILKSKS